MNYRKKITALLTFLCLGLVSTKTNSNPLELYIQLHNTTEDSQIEAKIRSFTSNPDFSLDASDKHGNTALMIAARNGNSSIARQLLTFGASIDKKNKYGHTPLSIAQEYNHENFVNLIHEFSPMSFYGEETVELIDKNKQLRDAIESEDETLVRKLLYGRDRIKDVNQADSDGITPLMIATKIKSSTNIMQHLLSRGANIYARDNKGYSPFYWASGNNNGQALQLLMSTQSKQSQLLTEIEKTKNGQNWDYYFKKIIQLDSPEIIRSATFDSDENLSIMQEIIKKDPASVLAKGPFGVTPLIIAATRGKFAMADLLISSGADVCGKDVHSRTALMYLLEVTPPEIKKNKTKKILEPQKPSAPKPASKENKSLNQRRKLVAKK